MTNTDDNKIETVIKYMAKHVIFSNYFKILK